MLSGTRGFKYSFSTGRIASPRTAVCFSTVVPNIMMTSFVDRADILSIETEGAIATSSTFCVQILEREGCFDVCTSVLRSDDWSRDS